ncbi:NADH-quinone oxidoreductase subunit L [Gilliamella bombicola]|uniref:NADH-quinone oxidoreductase subunit L n=1 Tax=Gilliamella bombicola TaxID=1798182 RepID=A0A1C4BVA0_9GAMM|nr:proton-conducting transporter membrane subunit [Gilliamella bombicola]SCC10674.1 NADH-quinone oxidoreductase subunit L [Gilliamella bombicola]
MNLLYLTIIVPLLTFLILVCFGRHIRSINVMIIGISTMLVITLITIFSCIDFISNIVPDMSLVYTRPLWNWFSVGDFIVPISLTLDGLSLIFLVLISFFGFLIYFFAACYLTSSKDIYNFYAYSNLLIASILTVILVDNLFVMLIGWEGVSISTYLLIGIYYQQARNGYAAVKAFIMMHLTDIFLILGIFLLYQTVETLNIRDVLTQAHDNLAVDSDIIFWITLMLFLGAMSKSALFPMHSWFAQTTLAPMPAVALLQSSTVILAGVYLVLRLSNLFMMSNDVLAIISIMSSLTILFASTIALVQYDIKRIITYINLAQISYIFYAFSTQNWSLSLNYLINYAVTSTLLILASSILIKKCQGERDISKMGGLIKSFPMLYSVFLFIMISLSAMPWISSSFYIKGDIILGLMAQDKLISGTIGLLGILLSSLNIWRLISIIFYHKQKQSDFAKTKWISYLPIFILLIFPTALFIYFPLPIRGIVPIAELDTNGQLLFQLLLAAVTGLSFLIAYILYARPNSEVQEVLNTPMIKFFLRLCNSDWRYDYLLHTLFVKPYVYLANLLKKDPLILWDNWILWGIRKVNEFIVDLENGQIRWYMLSMVIGSITILMLLIFI